MRLKSYCLLKCEIIYCVFSWSLVLGQIRYSIPEELQLGAFVGNIAGDLGFDVKLLSSRSLRISPGSRKLYVDVNLENGVLFVKEKIDRENLCGSSLTCVISLDAVLENPLNLYQVAVEILDVNDNAPSFPKSQFRLEISEAAAIGARFPLESAHDPDIGNNSLQTYQLLPNEYFTLDIQMHRGDRKLPVLVLQRPLDREAVSVHRLNLIAKDGGVPLRSGTVQVTIIVKDVNDNAPVFPQSVYTVNVLETATPGTQIITLNATDLDDGKNGEIMYSLSSHSSARVREVFEVDPKTGEIRVKGKLDYEENKAFEINIQAIDKGSAGVPAHCDVLVTIIDVNDNHPEVSLMSLSRTVSEDIPVGTVVALFSAADQDSGQNGQVQCQISNKLPFKLDSALKNYYRLLVQDLLDRENISKHDITISCTDAGNPPLTTKKTIRVDVSDINDNAPRFSQRFYTANVMENNGVGSSIFSLSAFDPDVGDNALLKYSIIETRVQNVSVSTYVSISSDSGIIFAQTSFDYEQMKTFQMQVQVRDSGSPSLTSNVSVAVIILDQNDNAPVIIQPVAEFGSTAVETISRFAEPGYLVAKVSATDADAGQNALLAYSIFQATQHNLFTISSNTGEIWTTRRIVNTDASKQRLVIVVKDAGTPSFSASVTIILSVVGSDIETFSSVSSSSEASASTPDLSFTLVISLGIISTVFLAILIVLAIKVHKNRKALGGQHFSLGICCCIDTRKSLNGIQKASRNLQIPSNYVEVFGGDPLSQRFRYESCSTLQSTKRGFINSKTSKSSTDKDYIRSESIRKENSEIINWQNHNNSVNSEMLYSSKVISSEMYTPLFKGKKKTVYLMGVS
ncbi:protocadherin-10-like [Rhincodon typus]|uniref:protocadherin-10-like n=1 Tax=Rhincodon typus TaxID=259920 RepID=UPI00202E7CBC|nr:protocadherin-10-like [Rhincodon typus]